MRLHEPVAITGYETLTPLGLSEEESYRRIINGESGIGSLPKELEMPDLGIRAVAQVKGFDDEYFRSRVKLDKPREYPFLHRSGEFTLAAAEGAMGMAGLAVRGSVKIDGPISPDDIGVSVYTGAGGANIFGSLELKRTDIHQFLARKKSDLTWEEILDGLPGNDDEKRKLSLSLEQQKLSPSEIMQALPERPSSILSMHSGATAFIGGGTGACAAGNYAIIHGVEQIVLGNAKAVIAGGTEAQINRIALPMFGFLGALDRENDPENASTPFNKEAKGFVMGEGAGMFVLESLRGALERGAEIHGVITGIGKSGDGKPTSSTDMDENGPAKAMGRALEGLRRDYSEMLVSAHATSTKADGKELQAMTIAMGDKIQQILGVYAAKSAYGHTIGPSGPLALANGISIMRHGVIPPILKLDDPLDFALENKVPLVRSRMNAPVMAVLVSAYGFGGHNTAILVEKFDEKLHRPA